MKKNHKLTLALLLLGTSASYAQQNVGIGTQMPDNSAVLDIQSADKGLLIPRMTLDQRNLISNPANGLMIYQTNETSGFYYFNGDKWASLSDSEANSITNDPNDWTMSGNPTATAANFIGTPAGVPINFKIGSQQAGKIDVVTRSTFLGNESGKISTGNDNAGFGYFSLRANTGGLGNMGFGTYSLIKNTTGNYNVGIGTSSVQENTTGSYNIGIGIGSLRSALGERNIGIGAYAGFASTGSYNVFLGNEAGRNEVGSGKLYISNSNTTTPLLYGDFSAKFISIGDVPVAKRNAVATAGTYGLLVKGGILTEKVKVALSTTADWADYVFEPSYNLMSLEKVEEFTKENKHLPNVPSAEEMAEGGLDVAQTSKMFMEKIEELTLYMIEMNKEIKSLKMENELLRGNLK